MSHEAQILVFSDFPAEGEQISQAIRDISDRPVRTATDIATAFEIVDAHAPEIVFVRLQAGAVAATCFLNEVWTRHPQATRFLLGDVPPGSDALVRCALGPHQFIRGPVDSQKLAAALSRADSIRSFVQNEKIRDLVARMRTLPSRPALSIEIMREIRSAKTSASAVADLISRDVAISTKLIQMANSAFYRGDQQVSNPVDAILLIGLGTTAGLVLSIETVSQMDKLKPLYFSMDRVWKHGQSVADLGGKISQTMGCDGETNANVFTAGLLHDIGKIALALNFEEDYERIPRDAEKKGLSVPQAEEEFFGASHAETGAYLLALWGMPLPIVEAVAGHHRSPDRLSKEFPAVTALHLANRLVNASENLDLETLDKILAEYPSELELPSRVEQFRNLLGISKRRSPKKRVPASNPQPAKTNSHPSHSPAPAPRSRRVLPFAFAATVAALAALVFYSWPRIVSLSSPQAQVRAEASQLLSKAEAPDGADQLPISDHGTTLEQPILPVLPEQTTAPEYSPALEQPFPFDHLFPIEEPSSPEHPSQEQGDAITTSEAEGTQTSTLGGSN